MWSALRNDSSFDRALAQRNKLAKRTKWKRQYQVEALESRTLLASVPAGLLSVTDAGAVSFLSQLVSGTTVSLSFNAGTDTYTFDDDEGVGLGPGGVSPEFTYTQVTVNEATLTPTGSPTFQNFTSLSFDQNVENINYSITSLDTATTFVDTSLPPPSGTPQSDSFYFGATGLAQSLITADVSIALTTEFAVITVDDSSDPTAQVINVSSNQVDFNGTPAFDYASPTNVASLVVLGGFGGSTFNVSSTIGTGPTTLELGTGTNTVNVLATDPGGFLTILTDGGSDTVNVGSAGTLTDIFSPVSVYGFSPSDPTTLNIDDHNDTTSSTATLDDLSDNFYSPFEVTGLSPAPITYGLGVTAVNITGGTFGATGVAFDIYDTQDGTTTTITGGPNQNFFNLSNALETGGLDNLPGPVVVNGGDSGTDAVTLDDSSRISGPNEYIITATTVSGGITFGGLSYGTIGTLTLNAQNNLAVPENSIDINSTADGVTTNVNGQGSVAVISVNSTGSLGTLNVSTGASVGGNITIVGVAADNQPVNITPGSPGDAVIIGTTGGDGAGTMEGILGPIGIIGSPNLYDVHFHDENDTTPHTWTLNSDDSSNTASVALSGGIATTTYRPGDLDSALTIFGGSGGNTFNVNNTTGFQSTSLFTGVGDDTVNVFATGDSTLDIDGQAGADTVTLGALAGVGMQDLTGTISVANDTGATTLILDDSQDTTSQTAALTTSLISSAPLGTVTGLSPATINYDEVDVSSLTVDGGSGGNTFNIDGTLVNPSFPATPTTLNTGVGDNTVNVNATNAGSLLAIQGQGGFDTVNIGSAGALTDIFSPVSVTDSNPTGTATLNIDDHNDATNATATLDDLSGNPYSPFEVTGLSPAPITYGIGVTALNITGGTSANGTAGVTFNIYDTQSGTTTTITGGAHQNVFNLSNASETGGLDNLPGPVVVNGGASGTDAVTLDDSSADRNDDYTITDTTVSRPVFGGLTYDSIGILTLNAENNLGTNGNNTININSTANGIATNVNGQGGVDTINVNSSGTLGTLNVSTGPVSGSTVNMVADNQPVNITVGAVDDFVNIGSTGGAGTMAGILGAIGITGSPDFYTLTFHDENDSTGHTWTLNNNDGLNNATVALSGGIATTTYQPKDLLGELTFNGGSGGNTFIVNNTTGFTETVLNTGTGADTVNVFATGNEVLSIDGQAGANTVTLGALASVGMQDLTGVIDVVTSPGSTTLTLDDSEDTTGQTATLTDNTMLGTMTGLSPATINYTDAGISSLTVDGGSGGDRFSIHGTLTNPSFPATLTTLSTGTGDNTVNVYATSAGSSLAINGEGGFDTVDIGLGTLSDILGAVTIDNTAADLDDLTIDGSVDPLSHTFDLSSSGAASTLVDELGNMPGDITYTTAIIDTLTIDAGPAADQFLDIDFSGGDPIPTFGAPGLIFNAGANATSPLGSHGMNLFNELPTGPFATETHNANDPSVFPQAGQYGSIDFTDPSGIATSLWYTGLQPIDDTTPAANYTFNDLASDQSFTASDGPMVLGFNTIQFANTPATPPPTFETTNVANKTNIVFNTPSAGTPLAITGVINIPTAAAGLQSLQFNVGNGNDQVTVTATPSIANFGVALGTGNDTVNINGFGLAAGPVYQFNGGPGLNTLNFESGTQPVGFTQNTITFNGVVINYVNFQVVNALTLEVINTNDSGAGSLRQALLTANGYAGFDTITFDIPGAGVHTITPATPLPEITASVVIDGYSQPGAGPNSLLVGDNAVLLIQIDGSLLGSGAINDGFDVKTNNSVISGLVIGNFSGAAIQVDGTGNTIEGDFVGTNPTGTVAQGNSGIGAVLLREFNSNDLVSNNTIGGSTPAARNVISGNSGDGVRIDATAGTGNVIQGNYIGTNAAGTETLPNGDFGIISSLDQTLIGGLTAATRNLVSGNTAGGIYVQGHQNVVEGNYVGTDRTGTRAVGNGDGGGIDLQDSNNTIGGVTPATANLVSGNAGPGIILSAALSPLPNKNFVFGNDIGTDYTGTQPLGNSGPGIDLFVASNNVIGGTGSGEANLIAANGGNGITVEGLLENGTFYDSTGNQIAGNLIGTNVSGTKALGNAGAGVSIQNTNGNTVGPDNVISGNAMSGVALLGSVVQGVFLGATSNTIVSNKIGTNSAGSAAVPNGLDGILLTDAATNSISGNLVSGNGASGEQAAGIDIQNANSTGNTISDNLIGTNATGTFAVGNSLHGVFVGNGASHNVIGPGNVISGNGGPSVQGVGVYIDGTATQSNSVIGNFIGTNAAGTAGITASSVGVLINNAPDNVIGGSSVADRNFISGNSVVGVYIALAGATGNVVQNNYIGTDVSGLAGIPNGVDGIYINGAPGNAIGGTAPGTGNLISANKSAGIQILGAGATTNQIFRNGIGLNANGRLTLPNGITGIFSQIPITANDFGASTGNANLGQIVPWQSPSSIGGGSVSAAGEAAVAAHRRKISRARSVARHHHPLSKRKTVITTGVHDHPNAKLALGLSRKTPASARGGNLTQAAQVKVKVATVRQSEGRHTSH
jgi:hypothetical protein